MAELLRMECEQNYEVELDQSYAVELESVIQNCMDKIFKRLGGGYKESVYQNAFTHELRTMGYNVSKEVNVPVLYEGIEVGVVRLDLVVWRSYNVDEVAKQDGIIIEFKAIQKIGEKEKNQIKRYLQLCDGKEGYLINCNIERFEVFKIQV